jgi:glycosyltransferase involved in cell wall biosynthesis
MCSRDRADQLATALPAVTDALRPQDRAIVVDSASRDAATAETARAAGVDVVRIDLPGLSRARNAGVRAATTEVIAFTDDDCRPTRGWVDAIRTHFADPAIGFVTGRVAADDAGGATASTLEREALVRYRGAQDPYGIGHGANMAYRRSALEQLGWFDEALGSGSGLRSGEDADMLHRCLAAGWEGVYDPAVVVAHDQWRDDGAVVKLRYGYGMGNGAYRVKAVRAGDARPRFVARSLVQQGLRPLAASIVKRDRTLFLSSVSWTSGMCVGMARASRRPLDGPNFA